MNSWTSISVLYAAGILLLVADFFLPSHGLLTVMSFGALAYGLYLTFQVSQEAGLLALLALLIGIPLILRFAIRHWHATWFGRKISPPNPVLSYEDRMPVRELEAMVGRVGRTLTPLRPVGMCLFGEQRVECVSEQGMLDAQIEVEAIRLNDRTLVVRPAR